MSITSFFTEIIETTSINLVWDGSYDNVSIKQSNDNTTFIDISNNITDNSYNITNLTNNTLYYFTIAPFDSSGVEGINKNTFATTNYTIEISSFYSGKSTITTIPLYWSGTYYKVNVYKRLTEIEDVFTFVDTVVGNTNYTINYLKEDTSYDLYIIPYNIEGEEGTESSILTISTDYTPIITNFYLDTITSTTATLKWTGKYTYITIQKSTNNINFITDARMITGTDIISYDGSFCITSLYPNIKYYFRIIPYSDSFNPGSYSGTINGTTLMGFSSFTNEIPTNSSVVLNWTGVYSKMKVIKNYGTIDSSNDYLIADITTPSYILTDNSYTSISLDSYTTYNFYLKPYNGITETTISDTISIITDFSAEVNVIINDYDISTNSIDITFNTTNVNYPYYNKTLIQLLTEENTIYSDISLISQQITEGNNYTYSITDLTPDTSYNIHILPYSLYNVSGTSVYKSIATKGYIDNTKTIIYLDTSNNIVLDTSGIYTTTTIQYYSINEISTSTNTIINIPDITEYPYTLYDLSSSYRYSFNIIPLNQYDISGISSNTIYNPVITEFYISDMSSSELTINWDGNYDYIKLQYSTYDNSNIFIDISTCYTTNITLYISYNNTSVYYRIIPYYILNDEDISGRITETIFYPIITNIELDFLSNTTIGLEWYGLYDYINIQYYSNQDSSINTIILNTNSTDLSNTYSIDISNIIGFDPSDITYYLNIIPYTNGYGLYTEIETKGLITKTVYNATITDISGIKYENNPTTGITIYYTGIFYRANLSYNIFGETYYNIIELNEDETSKTIYNLIPNTTYSFNIIPYNTELFNYNDKFTSDDFTITTDTIETYLNLTYDSSNSTADSIRISWTNLYYEYIKIYDSLENFIIKIDNTGNNYYDSSGIETLSSNTEYIYKIKIYNVLSQNTESFDITTYTMASFIDLDLNYEPYETSVYFNWTGTNYNNISIQNSTTSSDINNISSSQDNSYNSGQDIYGDDNVLTGKSLLPNTEYNYIFTLTNQQDISTNYNITITTAAQIQFRFTETATATTTNIPIQLYGSFTSAKIHIGTQSGIYDNTISISNVIPVNTISNMLYYYPFNEIYQDYIDNYNNGYNINDIIYNNISLTTENRVGLRSIYLDTTSYLKIPKIDNSYNDLTIALWFKSNNTSGYSAKIFDFSGSSSRLYCDVGSGNNLNLTDITEYTFIYYIDNTGIEQKINLSTNYNDNNWYHLTIIFTLDKWSIYINGIEIQSIIPSNSLFSSFSTNFIGKSIISTDYFNGYIDDLRIYDISLSSTEILNLVYMGEYDFSLNTINTSNVITGSPATYYIKVVGINGEGIENTINSYINSIIIS